VQIVSPPPGLDPRTVQPAANYYAIRAHPIITQAGNFFLFLEQHLNAEQGRLATVIGKLIRYFHKTNNVYYSSLTSTEVV
jgi:hypothetical protein